jgi:type III pantothenate kinase
VVGTGGYSDTIAEATEIFDALDPDITIRGIYQIWAHAVEKHAARVQ